MTERITPYELRSVVGTAFEAARVPASDAKAVAEVLVLAELFDIPTHGVRRVSQYVDRMRQGGVVAQAEIEVEQVGAALSRVDARNALGPVAGMRALSLAMGSARDSGVGVVFVNNSNHFGAIMPYCYLAAQEGFASIIFSNASTTMAPHGGRDARLGNNPLGLGVPNPAGDPVILDFALSAAARGKIRQAANNGEPIPAEWAVDRSGQPTTDAQAALEGQLSPTGGHKGYGLAVMLDIFAGVLGNASYLTHVGSWDRNPERPKNLGHCFLLINARRLGGEGWLARRVADFTSILHSTQPLSSDRPVLLPGEREMAAFHSNSRNGLAIPPPLLATLREMAKQ